MKFHLVHIIPDPRMHGLNGYREVINTIQRGLTDLGHEATLDVNSLARDKVNILFGAQMIPETMIPQLPPNTIIYNMEQIANLSPNEVRPCLRAAARKFAIWDYSPRNAETWKLLEPRTPVQVLPVGYAPVLDRIPKREHDIDVLFYGITSPNRLAAIDQICRIGLRVVFACGLYGASRDDLISRAKLVLNINVYQQMRVFEIVRVSYLLANGKAVVSDIYADSVIEPELRQMMAFAPPERLAETCADLIRNEHKRRDLEARALEFRQRDIREYLKPVLATLSSPLG